MDQENITADLVRITAKFEILLQKILPHGYLVRSTASIAAFADRVGKALVMDLRIYPTGEFVAAIAEPASFFFRLTNDNFIVF